MYYSIGLRFDQSRACHREHHIRSASTHRYEPLTTRLKFAEHHFSRSGPKPWNTLFPKIPGLIDLSTFKPWPENCFILTHSHCFVMAVFSRCCSLRCKRRTVCIVLYYKLSLSCAPPAADGWPLWVNRPLQVSQLSLSSFRDEWVVSCYWMSSLVAPSGECLQGDGRCAHRIVSNLAPLYLAAYLPVLNPAVGCTWSACHDVYSAVLRVSCCTS